MDENALNTTTAKQLYKFAEMNGFTKRPFEDVLNEYLTTKEIAESYGT